MLETMRDRVSCLEEHVGVLPEGHSTMVVEMAMTHEVRLLTIEGTLGDFMAQTNKRLEEIIAELEDIPYPISFNIKTLKEELDLTNTEVALVKKAYVDSSPKADNNSKVKIPEPLVFSGLRDAKELENFLWDIEKYYKIAKIIEEAQVGIASMCLTSNANLWWGT